MLVKNERSTLNGRGMKDLFVLFEKLGTGEGRHQIRSGFSDLTGHEKQE